MYIKGIGAKNPDFKQSMNLLWNGDIDSIRALIHTEADLHSKDNSGWTAIGWAVRNGHRNNTIEALKVLVEAGANVDDRAEFGSTLLMHVIYSATDREDMISVVKELISIGADVNARDESGCTPLMYATYHAADHKDFVDLIQELVKAGADMSAKDETGKTALDYAEKWGSVLIEIGMPLLHY